MTRRSRTALIAAFSTALIASAAVAQDGNEPSTTKKSTFDITLRGGFGYQWGTGISGEGDLDIARFRAGITAKTDLSRDLDLSLRLDFGLDDYDFQGDTTFGGRSPWEDVYTIGIATVFTYQPANDWSIFAGPVINFSAEGDADLDDGFTMGGVVGGTYQASDGFVIGGGLWIYEELEDQTTVFPIFILEWEISNDLRLSSTSASSSAQRAGLELIYDLAKDWELAGGVGYDHHRFRLDEDGVAPGGVGVENGWPIWARLSYQMNQNVQFSLLAGISTNGEVELRDSSGDELSSADVETALTIGIHARIRF